jgi:HEAT repeat protein
MDSILRNFSQLMNSLLILTAVLAIVAAGVIVLLVVLTVHRVWEYFRVRRLDKLSVQLHGQWRDIVRGDIPIEAWRRSSMKCEIVQSIILQEISAATDKDRAGLQKFLRSSSLADRSIERVLDGRGWRQRRAMLALGAMRVPEAIEPLAELLDDRHLETRMIAVESLGKLCLMEAAQPIIEPLMLGTLRVPPGPVINALVRCYLNQPEAILPYLRRAQGEAREILARVASELPTLGMADEMILLAGDPSAEVRACAAKALSVAPLPVAIPALGNLVRDEAWFVRLRAVSSLNQIPHPRVIPFLLEALRDSNRLVRTRAAAAIAKFEHETQEILQTVADSRNRYALHAMISAIELAGGFEKVIARLADPLRHEETAALLLDALREGAAGMWATRPADPVVETVFP